MGQIENDLDSVSAQSHYTDTYVTEICEESGRGRGCAQWKAKLEGNLLVRSLCLLPLCLPLSETLLIAGT